MFSKRFVSVYFSSNEIRVVQLDSSRKELKFAHTVPLPSGLISNRNVENVDGLASLLKAFWMKAHIKDKFVGLVIPEFSTLTKTVTIPKVEYSEVDEAIRWEAQEYLPWSEQETILDWKIVKESNDEIEALFVAVKKEVLQGYVDAISRAGLFPIVVETPSLSLARLSTESPKGKFLFYGGKNSSVFILLQGETIIGSSIVYSNDLKDLISTASKMMEHYNKVTVELVEIDGPSATAEFGKKLAEMFKVTPTLLSAPLSKSVQKTGREYLVPISLQLKNPSEPADMYTISLLPSDWVKRYELKKLRLQIWSLTLVVSYIVWFSFLAVLATYLYLGQLSGQIQQAEGSLRQTNPEKVQIIEDINTINELSAKTVRITEATVYPQTIVNAIYQARPEGISIARYSVDLDSGQISLVGISNNRQSLIAFKQKLEEQEHFSLVDIPIAALEVSKDAEFTMNFSYLPISSKVQPIKKTK